MFSDLLFRLRAVFERGGMERELDEELRFHVEREAKKLERASRWLESLLFGVERMDPPVIALVLCLLAAVAWGAAFLTAWRATRIDPMAALRAE